MDKSGKESNKGNALWLCTKGNHGNCTMVTITVHMICTYAGPGNTGTTGDSTFRGRPQLRNHNSIYILNMLNINVINMINHVNLEKTFSK